MNTRFIPEYISSDTEIDNISQSNEPLSNEEVLFLFTCLEEWRQPNRIKNIIANKYMYLVHEISKNTYDRYFSSADEVEYEDIFAYGLEWLASAMHNFDTTNWKKFTKNLKIQILGKILDETGGNRVTNHILHDTVELPSDSFSPERACIEDSTSNDIMRILKATIISPTWNPINNKRDYYIHLLHIWLWGHDSHTLNKIWEKVDLSVPWVKGVLLKYKIQIENACKNVVYIS